MSRILREPLLHFLLGGLALFLLYGRVAGPGSGAPDRIVVSEDRVAMLAQTFQRTWMRPPTQSELDGLLDDFITEEVLYREALALGLDRDDLVVRRRMRQKMEFLNEGIGEPEPGDEELSDFLEANAERFRVPSRLSFVQVFVNPEEGSVEERAADLLARLRAGAAPDALGDSTLLPAGLSAASAREVARTFGAPFAQALEDAPVGDWSGPFASSYGIHLVRVGEREPGRLPDLAEVRGSVAREWGAKRREEARARFYEKLRARYEIEVRVPDVTSAAASAPPAEAPEQP